MIPSGTEMAMAIATMTAVPMNDWTIPPPGLPGAAGSLVKKSTFSAEMPSLSTW